MIPTVSVIIPVYNVEAYLDKCLSSVLAQSYPHYQVIAVNDGSTDNSLNILNSYENKFTDIKIISTENRGVGEARNLGL